jgi:fibro-slime domain-containing protein
MTSSRHPFRTILWVLGCFLLFVAPAQAGKTLMFLTDWYVQYPDGFDSLARMDSVFIQKYDSVKNSGNYYGSAPFYLEQTDAYADSLPVHATDPATVKVPRNLARLWYSIPDYNPANFKEQKFKIYSYYKRLYHRPLSNGQMQIDTGLEHGETGEMNTNQTLSIDSCGTALHGDTIWVRSTDAISNNPKNYVCYDHNPFLKKVGTVHLLNPWPGRTAYVQAGNRWYPLYNEADRPGWSSTSIWVDPRTTVPFKVVFASSDPNGAGVPQYLDATGFSGMITTAFDFTTKPGQGSEVWVIPPTKTSKPTFTDTAPGLKLTLMIHRPAWGAAALRVQWQGSYARYVAIATKYCNWFQMNFYDGAVPANIVLRHPLRDTIFGSKGLEAAPSDMGTYANWISMTPSLLLGKVQWLDSDGNRPVFGASQPAGVGLCDTKVLAFSAYDYGSDYTPFAQNGPKDNCGLTKGLVRSTLNAKGRPIWSGKVNCDIGSLTDGPQYWYDSLYRDNGIITQTRSATAKAVNAFICMPLTLKLDTLLGYYAYDNQRFFPLDTFKTLKDGSVNAFNQGTPNFHFAMHAKASFEYVPGLQFKFRGDDDVWIFIDKKLALDLGGQHNPEVGEIKLDNLGLVEGKSYQFDMFYSERHTDGSSILIQTTMNLVPTVDVQVDSSVSGTSGLDYKIWTVETSNRADVCPENGVQSSATRRPGVATTYTLLFPDGTREVLDSAKAVSYPGLRIYEGNSRINVDTVRLKNSGKFTSGTHVIEISYGTFTQTISFTVLSLSVKATATLYDRNGDGRADSVLVTAPNGAKAFRKTFAAVVHWADSIGIADSVSIPSSDFTILGDSAVSGTFKLPFRTSCPPGGCKGDMGRIWGVTGGDTVKNAIVEVRDGIAPVADSAWLSFDTTGSGLDTLFVWASEGIARYLGASALPSGDSAWVLLGNPALHRELHEPAQVDGNLLKIVLDPNANPVLSGDWLRLGGYSADGLGNAPRDSSRWIPIGSNPVARSWMLDVNGDGRPDSVGVMSKGDLSAATKVAVHWKTATGADTTVNVVVNGIAKGFALGSTTLANATGCNGCSIDVTVGGEVRHFPLLDSVPAVALKADYRFGVMLDTLVVRASEFLTKGSAVGEDFVAGKLAGGASLSGTLVVGSGTLSDNMLRLLVMPSAFTGDSLRLRAWSADLSGNVPGAVSPWVKVVYGPQAIRMVLRDRDGDGMADSLTVSLTRSANLKTPDAFVAVWGGQRVSVAGLVRAADSLSWTGRVGPYVLGTSSKSGDAGWMVFGTDSLTYRAAVEDSVAPVAISGRLAFGKEPSDPDTLDVQGSESLLMGGIELVSLNSDSGETGSFSPSATQTISSGIQSATRLRILLKSGSVPDGSTWVRLGTSMSDLGGAKVGEHSRWVRLSVVVSGMSFLFDANGDGTADSVLVKVRGKFAGVNSTVVHWQDAQQRDTAITVPVAGDATKGFALPAGFLPGATSSASGSLDLYAGTTLIASLPMLDSVAPIALKARYRYGPAAGPDTIVVETSEYLTIRNDGVGLAGTKSAGDASLTGSVVNVVNGYSVGSNLVMVIDPATWSGADSLRLRDNASDARGNIPGRESPFVGISYGLPPVQAVLRDPSGQGIASAVIIRPSRPGSSTAMRGLAGVRLSWSHLDGSADSRQVLSSELVFDSVTGIWSGNLREPFEQGVTSCLGVCNGTAAVADGSAIPLQMVDSIAPVLTSAKLRYSAVEVARDTLLLQLSEPWASPDADGSSLDLPFIKLGRGPVAKDVAPMLHWTLSSDGQTLIVIMDTVLSLTYTSNDSVWLLDRVRDFDRNVPGSNARRVPLQLGQRPLQLKIGVWPAILHNDGANTWPPPAAGTPQFEILTRLKNVPGPWQKADGGTMQGIPGNDTNHLVGMLVTLNRPLSGMLYIYDQLGIAVGSVDLKPLAEAWKALPSDSTGDGIGKMRQVWITWNGTDKNRRFAASGVYVLRLVAVVETTPGKFQMQNIIERVGWSRYK